MSSACRSDRQISAYQWLVLIVAWLGWAFDSMDATIYSLVLTPALRELLGPRGAPEAIGWYGGIIFSVFIIGWALGGVAFGIAADYLGRARTLVITILIYAVFTAAAGLAHSWWELALYRFVTALGIGGEWAAGATLVAEVWPESRRVTAAGLLQSAWGAGYFLAAVMSFLLAEHGWRIMFFVGLLPAVIALLARLKVREPEMWTHGRTHGKAGPRVRELFRPGLRRDTLIGSLLAFVAVFGLWGATNWTPSLVREALESLRLPETETARRASWAVMDLNIGAIAGYLAFPVLAQRIGRRPAFFVWMAGAALALPGSFLLLRSYAALLWALPVLGFFTNGLFSGFPIYLPELFPTRIRATGSGFCFNAGRLVAASGPFLTGYLVGKTGSFAYAASAIALVYLLGIAVLLFARETRGRALA